MANTYTGQLNLRMPDIGDLDWGDEVNDNVEILEQAVSQMLKGNSVVSGLVASDGGGLQVDYTAGSAVIGGTSYNISASNKTCAASDLNWLYVDDTGTVQISITAPTGNFAMIAMIDAGSTILDRIGDMRNLAESILSLDITFTPDNYTLDTGESSEIEQHLSGIDDNFGHGHGFKDKIINGNLNVWYYGTSFTSIASNAFFANRFSFPNGNGAVFDIARSYEVPNDNFNFSAKIDVTTADASIDNVTAWQYKIEGYDFKPLVGKTSTLGFWVNSNKTGTYCVSFQSSTGDRSYIAEYTIDSADTWEFKTITLDFDYSGGTWDYGYQTGLQIRFVLACDATRQSTADSWLTGNYQATSNQVNFLDSTSNYLHFTGVSLGEGSKALPLCGRSIKQERELCFRYYETNVVSSYVCVAMNSTSNLSRRGTVRFAVPKRASPTITLTGPVGFSPTQPSVTSGTDGFIVYANASSATQITHCPTWAADAEL